MEIENIKEFISKSKQDHSYYCRTALFIRTDSQELIPFVFNPFQKKLDELVKKTEAENRLKRFVVVKPRRAGCSTYIESRGFKKWHLEKNADIRIVAQENGTADVIFDMSKIFYDMLPPEITPEVKFNNQKQLKTENTYSNFRIYTAGTKSAIRGAGSQFIHFTEVAYYERPDIVTGAKNSVKKLPNTEIWFESTPNGKNYFYELYFSAKEGRSEYINVFFPWYEIPEYSMPFPDERFKEDFVESVLNHKFVERYGDEETEMSLYKLTWEQLYWRRYTIRNECDNHLDTFKAEYPVDDETYFLTSGGTVFNIPVCITMQRLAKDIPYEQGDLIPVVDNKGNPTGDFSFKKDSNGFIKIWKHPDRQKFKNRYGSGWDIAEGVDDGDYTVGRIYDRVIEQPILTYRSLLSFEKMGWEIYKICKYYGLDVMVNIERNNLGIAVIRDLLKWYANLYVTRTFHKKSEETIQKYGYYTGVNKGILVGEGMKWIDEGKWNDPDEMAWEEKLTFIKEPTPHGYKFHAIDKGKRGHSARSYDDYVLADLLTMECIRVMPPLEELIEEPKWVQEMKEDAESMLSFMSL